MNYDYGDDPCPECLKLLTTQPKELKNGILLYRNSKTLCYTNLPKEIYEDW